MICSLVLGIDNDKDTIRCRRGARLDTDELSERLGHAAGVMSEGGEWKDPPTDAYMLARNCSYVTMTNQLIHPSMPSNALHRGVALHRGDETAANDMTGITIKLGLFICCASSG